MDIEAINKAAELLLAAKQTEWFATEARMGAEQELLAIVPTKPEGIRDSIPAALFAQAIRYKPELITAGVRYLQQNEPGAYATLAQAFTAKPGKTSVVVERIETQLEQAA